MILSDIFTMYRFENVSIQDRVAIQLSIKPSDLIEGFTAFQETQNKDLEIGLFIKHGNVQARITGFEDFTVWAFYRADLQKWQVAYVAHIGLIQQEIAAQFCDTVNGFEAWKIG
jgi:hypothetical protein